METNFISEQEMRTENRIMGKGQGCATEGKIRKRSNKRKEPEDKAEEKISKWQKYRTPPRESQRYSQVIKDQGGYLEYEN